jgi:hypothetical protein
MLARRSPTPGATCGVDLTNLQTAASKTDRQTNRHIARTIVRRNQPLSRADQASDVRRRTAWATIERLIDACPSRDD